jgi:hypothetical protein
VQKLDGKEYPLPCDLMTSISLASLLHVFQIAETSKKTQAKLKSLSHKEADILCHPTFAQVSGSSWTKTFARRVTIFMTATFFLCLLHKHQKKKKASSLK